MKALLFNIGLFSTVALNAQNTAYLEINQVKALISNYNSMHWDMMGGGDARYEVPKGSGTIPGPNAGFASAFWIGGYDVANQLHLAAQTYRQGGDDFWAGPLDTINATTNSTTILQYNRLWKLNKTDINNFISNYANGSVGSGAYIPVADLLSWPANGSGAYSKKLAPYVDANNNGIYDPMIGGDYPKIKGDQAIYYIMNDNGAVHQNSGGLPLGVEIHAMAYAYGPGIETSYFPQLTYTTFYNYKLINRSNMDYHDVYVSMWDDVDIGYYGDDFIGCNVGGNYGYAYNATQNDPTNGSTIGYGSNPPASGHQVVKGPYADLNDNLDNDNDGTIDEACEQNLMNVFDYFSNPFTGVAAATTDPDNAAQFYNYMSGYWRDGSPFTCGGNAYGGTTSTKFVYPGNTYTTGVCGTSTWDELGAGGDRRYVLSTGPFSLDAKEIEEIEYALVTSFDPSTHDPVNKLKYDMNAIKVFSNNFDSFAACNTTLTNNPEIDKLNGFSIYPNPTNHNLSIDSDQSIISSIEILDVTGTLVLSSKVDNSTNLNLKVDNLPSGLYFLRLTSEGKSSIKKFVKE